MITKIEQEGEGKIFKITHEGVTLHIYNSTNTREPRLIIQMYNKKGSTLSIGLDKILAHGISNIIQRRITEL